MGKKSDIDKLMDLILEVANEKELNAAHSGSMYDYGASSMREQVRFYRLGQRNELPKEWEHYRHKLDPEWQEFQRLQKKFGDR